MKEYEIITNNYDANTVDNKYRISVITDEPLDSEEIDVSGTAFIKIGGTMVPSYQVLAIIEHDLPQEDF